ncbi:alpha/beta fold hydrolase [Bosea sp. 124]|uniref:alpha/beta fold hydrolase n=1 Tax=Bosea sp. 124 TaxID=2135642 RepID=UPI000D3A40CC|nr:alpha/beta fold hydrolase [Bosea sp. 124]PTM39806.1 homoserine O-acetyltransferase [Bosea sp. 124]
MTEPANCAIFDAGDVQLASGQVFRSMKLAYKTYGRLNAARDNVVVYPTSFSAQHFDTEWLISPDGVLDPDRYFIVIPNLFGNGLSSSPSNSPDAWADGRYPLVSYHDAVAVQHRLLVEQLHVDEIALVYGWSMGGMQAYHWAALHPDMVQRVAVVCGSARCAPFNHVFLEGVKAALHADPAFQNGRFVSQPTVGMRAMGRVYAGWALSYAFYHEEAWRGLGFESLEDFLTRSWDGAFARRAGDDLLAQIATWQNGDVSACARFGGDRSKALAAITARVLLMPGATDSYFQANDNADELPLLVNARSAELSPIPSIYGHRAGNPIHIPADRAFLRVKIQDLLAM